EEEMPVTSSTTRLTNLLSKKEFIVFAALHENEVVGGLTAYELPMHSSDHSEAYIYDIAVHSRFQRKGLGLKMIAALKDYCRQNGIQTFFVEAHGEDIHAVEFYHKAGGKAEKVVHFNFEV
ncbi:MAG TPA: GNAT family N-acetyltransferase, partial [Bacteroidia bacterium]|nr:GNAT family N-acetyltransferase [Bacteroidia bacterium]